MGRKGKSLGGNAHDRAVSRASETNENNGSTAPEQIEAPSSGATTPPLNQKASPLLESVNNSDSICIVGILIGIYFAIVAPPTIVKIVGLLLIIFGSVYVVCLSRWTNRLQPWQRSLLASVIVIGSAATTVPELVKQWKLDHMKSELNFAANAPGYVYPENTDVHGIKWQKRFVQIRMSVKSAASFPIQNLNLSIYSKGGLLIAGIAQDDPDPQGCVIRRPRIEVPRMIIRATDGSRADLSPDMTDDVSEIFPRDHEDLLCQRIESGESISLLIAVVPKDVNSTGETKPEFEVKGEYETTATEGSKRIPVDQTVPVSQLPRWK